MKTISSADLRKDLSRVLAETRHDAGEIVLTRSGEPIAVLVGIELLLATYIVAAK